MECLHHRERMITSIENVPDLASPNPIRFFFASVDGHGEAQDYARSGRAFPDAERSLVDLLYG
jgi:hypothetical protein